MAESITFSAGDHVPPAVAEELRGETDVLRAQEAGPLEADDERHLAFAPSQGRVIFTRDTGFLRLGAAGRPYAGSVYPPQQSPFPPSHAT